MQKFRRTHGAGMSAEDKAARRQSFGGSDARVLMSGDERAIERLWLEKRGEIDGEDLSEVIIVQFGNLVEGLNADWFEHTTGYWVTDEQKKMFFEDWPLAHSTLDGLVRQSEYGPPLGVFEGKFMLPFNEWSIEKALEKYWPQCQHNMMVTGLDRCWLSVITAFGQYKFIECEADFFYQVALLEAEKAFWECVVSGNAPECVSVNQPKPQAIRIVDMTHGPKSNEWIAKAGMLVETLSAVEIHECAKKELKKLFPADAAEAFGQGVKLKRSKDGKVLVDIEGSKDAKKAAKTAVLGEAAKPQRKSRAAAKPLADAA